MWSKIYIIGIGADGINGLTGRAKEYLLHADKIFGSEATLRLIPEANGERIRIGTDLNDIVDQLKKSLGQHQQVIVAGGDPLFYGVAKYLCDRLGKDTFEVMPHLSSMQLAFARVKETWEDAYLSDVSTKPLEQILDHVRIAETVGLFTNEVYHPARIARELLSRGLDYFRAHVCENLGGPKERITSGELHEIQEMVFDPLNILILRRKPGRPDLPKLHPKLKRFGNPDDIFAQSRPKSALITQAEVRAIALAQLDLQPGTIFWDVGAGSGSVALEAAQLIENGQVYAIEQEAIDYQLLVTNTQNFAIKNIRPVFGTAPAIFQDLPEADAIFVGGNGGEVTRLLESAYRHLRPHGRLVVHVGTLEMLSTSYEAMKHLQSRQSTVEVFLLQIARSVEQLESLRFEAINPTFLLKVIKPGLPGHDS